MKGWVVRCRRAGLRETLARLRATGLREDWVRRLRGLERAGPTPRPRACSRCQEFLQGWKPKPNACGITLAGILPDARIGNPPRGVKFSDGRAALRPPVAVDARVQDAPRRTPGPGWVRSVWRRQMPGPGLERAMSARGNTSAANGGGKRGIGSKVASVSSSSAEKGL